MLGTRVTAPDFIENSAKNKDSPYIGVGTSIGLCCDREDLMLEF
jgi:hypothetical protein